MDLGMPKNLWVLNYEPKLLNWNYILIIYLLEFNQLNCLSCIRSSIRNRYLTKYFLDRLIYHVYLYRDFGKLQLADGNFATICFERVKESYFVISEEEKHGPIRNKELQQFKCHHRSLMKIMRDLRHFLRPQNTTT